MYHTRPKDQIVVTIRVPSFEVVVRRGSLFLCKYYIRDILLPHTPEQI